MKKNALADLWQKTNVLHPRNLLQAILSVSSLKGLGRELKRTSGVWLTPEEIMLGIRRLLNSTALAELENVRISLPERKARRKKRKAADPSGEGDNADEPVPEEPEAQDEDCLGENTTSQAGRKP